MLKLNKLYSFLINQHQRLEDTAHLKKHFLVFKNSDPKKKFAMYMLSDKVQQLALNDSQGMDFKLHSHHVSFYSLEHSSNPYFSQYHYTAKLIDQNQHEYELHVYFKENDVLAHPPVLTQVNGSQKIKKIEITPELNQLLTNLANQHTSNLILDLRQQLDRYFIQLKNKYADLESKLTILSREIENHPDEYLAVLRACLKILPELNEYQGSGYYSHVQRLLTQIERAVITKEKPIREVKMPSPAIQKSPIPDSASGRFFTPKVKKSMKLRVETYLNQAIRLQKLYEETDRRQLDHKIERFLAFDQEVSNLILEEPSISWSTYSQIQFLITYRFKEGEKLVQQLLLNRDFDHAKLLINYAELNVGKLIKLALINNNAKLLDFLLTNFDYPINTTSIKEDMVPLVYCYTQHSEATPKTDCFKVLIKHRASLLTYVDGLPLAIKVFSESNPFNTQIRCTLTEARMNQMLNEIAPIIKSLPLSELNPEQVKAVIQASKKIKLLQGMYRNNSKQKLCLSKDDLSMVNFITDKLTPEIQMRVDEDDDIQAMHERIIRCNLQFRKQLSRIERLRLTKNSDDELNDKLDQLIPSHLTDWEAFKDQYLKNLEVMARLIELAMELKIAETTVRKKGKMNKGHNHFTRQELDIAKELMIEMEKFDAISSDYKKQRAEPTSTITPKENEIIIKESKSELDRNPSKHLIENNLFAEHKMPPTRQMGCKPERLADRKFIGSRSL